MNFFFLVYIYIYIIYIYIYIYIYIDIRKSFVCEPDEEFDTLRVWGNILDPIKYLSDRARRFLDSGMRIGLNISYSSLTQIPKYIYNIYLFYLKKS